MTELSTYSRKKLAKNTIALLEGWGIDNVDLISELLVVALRKLGKTDREKAIKRLIKTLNAVDEEPS
jgi:hypothetical protein